MWNVVITWGQPLLDSVCEFGETAQLAQLSVRLPSRISRVAKCGFSRSFELDFAKRSKKWEATEADAGAATTAGKW